jgi:hypothetical protein
MFSPATRLLSYLRPPPGSLWRWSDDGSVIVWADDSTILFREELKLILAQLVLSGWPSCSALVLLLAATRGKIPALHESLVSLGKELNTDLASKKKIGGTSGPPEAVHLKQVLNQKVEETLKLLGSLPNLPPELLKTPRNKAVLAELIFERQEATISAEDAPALLEVFTSTPLAFSTLSSAPEPIRKEPLLHDIHVLREGLKRMSPEVLKLRLQTGLDALPEKADVELPPARRMARLMTELAEDPEHSSLIHLVREVAASLYLPRTLDEHDEMALGGVSDITNRGTLDRLLLSELAHDDLTLAVRVALNEALYLRREPPSRQPPGRLLILLDSGVRMWGIPRVIGTAAAMAFTLRRDQHARTDCWRAQGDRLEEIDLLERAGLTRHFMSLEPSVHPGAALPRFLQECEQDEHSEAVIVTHLDVLQDEEFLSALSRFTLPCWVAGVERDGRFQVFQHPDGWSHPLCSAEIDLTRLLRAPVRPDALKHSADRLPLYLSLHPSPLLLPITGEVSYCQLTASAHYLIVAGRRLYRWETTNRGAALLSANLPPGRTLWVHEAPNGCVYVLKGHWENGFIPLACIPEDGSPQQTILLRVNCPPNEVCYLNGKLLLLYRPHVDVFDPETGEKLSTMKFGATMRWFTGRYCKTQDGWLYLDWDGNKLRVDNLKIPAHLNAAGIVAIFDRKGTQEGPWVLTSKGEVHFTAGQGGFHYQAPSVDISLLRFEISSDGHRLLLGNVGNQVLLDLEKKSCKAFTSGTSPVLNPTPHLPSANLRNRLSAIQVTEHGRILLKTRRGAWLETDLSPHQVIRLLPHKPAPLSCHEFVEEDSDAKDYSLHAATFPNGSKAWLDSRGFLHLTGGAPNQPELCLVLNDDHMTVWSSDGGLSGTPFFTSSNPLLPEVQQYQKIVDWARHAAC